MVQVMYYQSVMTQEDFRQWLLSAQVMYYQPLMPNITIKMAVNTKTARVRDAKCRELEWRSQASTYSPSAGLPEPPLDSLGSLSEIHDRCDDNARRLCFVENPIGELPQEHPPVWASIHWRYLRMLAQQRKCRVQLAHEHFTPPLLIIFIPLKGGLEVEVRL